MAKRSPMMDRLDALEAQLTDLRSASAANFSTLERELRARSIAGATADRRAAMSRLSGGLPSGASASFRSAGTPEVPEGLGMSMLDRLRAGTALSTGIATGASGDDWTVRGNLLRDSTFEHVIEGGTTLSAAYASFGEYWQARYVVNSGAAPAGITFYVQGWRDNRYGNPTGLHSTVMHVDAAFGGACDVTIQVRPTAASSVRPDYILAGLKFPYPTTQDAGVGTDSLTAKVQILDSTETTVISESEEYDLLASIDADEELSIWCVRESVTSNSLWRLELRFVKSSAGTDADIYFCEPQLQVVSEPAPAAFVPSIGHWTPSRVVTFDSGGAYEQPVIDAGYVPAGDTFLLYPDGRQVWNGDTTLTRDSAGYLDLAGSGATLMVGPQLVPLVFVQENVPAGTTASMSLSDIVMPTAIGMPWAGSVVGMSYRLTGVLTAGTLTLRALVNGTNIWAAHSLDSASPQDGEATQAYGTDTFAVGDTVGVEFASGGGMTPTTRELVVVLWLAVKYDGT